MADPLHILHFFHGIYCGPVPLPTELATRWNLDPFLLVLLMASALPLHSRWSGRAALLVLAIVFVSPLCALSSALFSARAVHHVLLVAVAAPLLAHAWPRRDSSGRRSVCPAFIVATALFWIWHVPVAYDLALSNKAVYWAMQFSLLTSAVWFWRAVFDRGLIEATSWVTAGFAQMGLLGALLTFAPAPLYAAHLEAPALWGLTALGDQQLAGLLMWIPAGIPYLAAVLFLIHDKQPAALGRTA